MIHTVESLMMLAFDAMDAARVWAVKNDDLTLASLGRKREALRAALTEALEQPADRPPLQVERKAAEYEYSTTAFDYPNNPIGSRDWALYWADWLARSTSAPQAAQPEQGFQEWWDTVADGYEVTHFKPMRRAWNAAQAAQPVREHLSPDVVRALWQQTLDATKGPLPIEEFATVLAKHYGIGVSK